MRARHFLEKSNFITLNRLPGFQGVKLAFHGILSDFQPQQALQQVHSNRHLNIQTVQRPPLGDAISTTQYGLELAIRTADCLPILLWDSNRVGGVHAGWKGLASGILQHTLPHYTPEKTKIVIGPAIGLCCFEVGQEVLEAFQIGLSLEDLDICITRGSNNKWHLDLAALAVLTLKDLGCHPEHIYVIRECTKHLPQWNSYRQQGPQTRHNWSTIEKTSS